MGDNDKKLSIGYYEECYLGEEIPECDRPAPIDESEFEIIRENLEKALELMSTDREREILLLKYSDSNMTDAIIASRLKISEERVTLAKLKARRKLTRPRRRIQK